MKRINLGLIIVHNYIFANCSSCDIGTIVTLIYHFDEYHF